MSDEELDAELVARAQAGDASAVAALYDRFADPVFRFVRFRVGNAHDAEDLAQRVFLLMIQALPRYQSRGTPFGAWLFRIARNAIIDHARTQRSTEPLEAAAEVGTVERGPEQQAITASEMDRVTAALARLTDDQREVVALRFFAQLSPAEIARVMGRREGTIRATQFRALAALRRLLEGTGR
jgi:RNA polymerase sigma-70 factor (ECF subfamily)